MREWLFRTCNYLDIKGFEGELVAGYPRGYGRRTIRGGCECAHLLRGDPGRETVDCLDAFHAAHPVETCALNGAVRHYYGADQATASVCVDLLSTLR